VIVSNHRSNLDIPAHFLSVPNPIRFLAKTELFKIPLLGATMRHIGIVEVDRARGAAIHRELNQSAHDNLEHTLSLMVYPEGTRSRDGAMHAFKKGAFAIAIENQLPLVPVTTYGSYAAWPPMSLVKGGRIITVVGEPVSTEGMTRENVGELTSSVRRQIVATFDALASADGPANPLEHSND
jgi:1-acyl-sn-glycerol-3-phosphate acyltransferase